MNVINNYYQIAETLISPIESVNRAAFAVARYPRLNSLKLSAPANENIILHPTPSVPWAHNFKNAHDNKELLNDSLNPDFEYLVKVKAPYGLEIGEKITLMASQAKAEYKVYQKIATQGLVSYALKPEDENLEPIIIFRCTEANPFKEHSLSSMQNDTDEKIGEKGWLSAETAFEQLMQNTQFRTENQKIKVAGYSLGGVHAQYFVSKHHKNVSHAIFYSDPSIDAEVANEFAKNVTGPITLQIFRTWGDPFTHFGGKHLGCEVTHPDVKVQLIEISTPNQNRFDTKFHSKRIFKTTDFNYTVEEFTDSKILAQKLNNKKRDCITAHVEKLRLKFGKYLSKLLATASSVKSCFLRFIEEEAQLHKRNSRTSKVAR